MFTLQRVLILKGQLTLGRKWAQLRGSRRPNSYHGDDALHLRSVKLFDLSRLETEMCSWYKAITKWSQLVFALNQGYAAESRCHSTYRLSSSSYWCTTIGYKLHSFRSRFKCRSRDDRSRTRARTRWSPDRSDRTYRADPQRILRMRRGRAPIPDNAPVRSAVELCTSTPTTKWVELESGEVQERQRRPGCSGSLFARRRLLGM